MILIVWISFIKLKYLYLKFEFKIISYGIMYFYYFISLLKIYIFYFLIKKIKLIKL